MTAPRIGSGIDGGVEGWLPVSPRYVWVDLVHLVLRFAVAAAIASVLALVVRTPLLWALPIAIGVLCVVVLCFVPRRVRSIGYALREDDLVFRRGIMFQRVVAVPYGRMQLVDVTRGPVARALSLAELRMLTASPTTGVAIPGLEVDEAHRLRDRLVAVAESRRAGL